jgi:hypothetical protein
MHSSAIINAKLHTLADPANSTGLQRFLKSDPVQYSEGGAFVASEAAFCKITTATCPAQCCATL